MIVEALVVRKAGEADVPGLPCSTCIYVDLLEVVKETLGLDLGVG